MKTGKYWLLNILTLMLGIPVIASIVILIVKVLFNCDLRDAAGVTVSAVATACGGAVMASIWGGRRLPETFFARYSPVLLALFCTLALWFSLLIMTDGDFENDLFFDVSHNIFFISYFITFFPFSADCDEIEPLQVLVLLIPTVACFSFAVTLAALSRRQGVQIRGRRGQRAALVVTGGLMLAVAALLGWQTYDRHYRLVEETDKYTLRANIDIWDYMPFWEGNRLTQLASPPTLHIGRDWPRLDGATALYPLYASAVQAIYQNQDETSIRELVDSYRTPLAYDSLIKGNVDMIFALEPSAQQREAASQRGLTLTLRPFAREAFVFVTHKDNPLRGLTTAQIRAIYAGSISNWREVGGPDERILPYQRPEGSGSQTAMLAGVMKGEAMGKPLETTEEGMDVLIRRVADYQNRANSLGYTFRYYATIMKHNDALRLLSIDGVAPVEENIRNGSYPLSVDIYMVTARPPSKNTQALIDWFLSPQGQQLVEDVGYVAIK